MKNRTKRDIIMSLLLGDGSIGVYGKGCQGRLTIDHGLAQKDYLIWKASLLDLTFNRNHKIRQGHKGKSVQVMAYDRKLRVYNKFVKFQGKKYLPNVLKWIDNEEFAMAIWLMDDGYCEPSISTLVTGEKKNYGCRFRLFTCDQTDEAMLKIKNWIDLKFNTNCKIIKHYKKSHDRYYPIIKFSGPETLIIWEKIRDLVLQFESMRYKFRYAEEMFQYKKSQRALDDATLSNDIVVPQCKLGI